MQNANPLTFQEGEKLELGTVLSEKDCIFQQYNFCFDYFSNLFPEFTGPGQSKHGKEDILSIVEKAVSLGLFQEGGIQKPSFVALLSIIGAFNPRVYVESGVFAGSSLFAFESAPTVKKIWGFDPNINGLRFSTSKKTKLISDLDFSAFNFPSDIEYQDSFVYFDDHINTATRIISAYEKGFRLLAFDDSNGITGIKNRLYPAMPTLPIINNIQHFSSDQVIEWNSHGKHVRFDFTPEIVDLCTEAKSRIMKFCAFPGPGTFYENYAMSDEKYLVALRA